MKIELTDKLIDNDEVSATGRLVLAVVAAFGGEAHIDDVYNVANKVVLKYGQPEEIMEQRLHHLEVDDG